MYESFYGLQKRPFSILPDHAFFYAGEKQQKALARLKHGITSQEGFTLITGEVGTGKTTLIGYLANQAWESATIGQLTNTHPALCGLLQWVLQAFGVPFDETNDVRLYQTFIEFVNREAEQGRRVVLIVDEAQYLMPPVIEELRLLANVNVCDQIFQVILVGQPDLLDLLRQPELREVAQRIVVAHRLEPLDSVETGRYIAHRIRVAGGDPDFFEPEARALVHRHSQGVPRVINSICDTALLYGFEEQQRAIDTSLVSEVVFDSVRNALLETRAITSDPPVEAATSHGKKKNGVQVNTAAAFREGEATSYVQVSEEFDAVPAGSQLALVPRNCSPFNYRSTDSEPRSAKRKRTINGTYSLVGEVVERSANVGQTMPPQPPGPESTHGVVAGAWGTGSGAGYNGHRSESEVLRGGVTTALSQPVEERTVNKPDAEVQKIARRRPAPQKKWDLNGALNALSGWLD